MRSDFTNGSGYFDPTVNSVMYGDRQKGVTVGLIKQQTRNRLLENFYCEIAPKMDSSEELLRTLETVRGKLSGRIKRKSGEDCFVLNKEKNALNTRAGKLQAGAMAEGYRFVHSPSRRPR